MAGAREVLTLDNIAGLGDGVAGAAFGVHLKRAALDCYDRPGDAKPRVVTLTVALVPVLEPQGGLCNSVKIQVHAESRVPKHRSKVYDVRLKPNGSLLFNPDSLDDADQQTLLPDKDDED